MAVVKSARGRPAEIERSVQAEAGSGAVVAVDVHCSANLRAEDRFHPNDGGYALIAADFAQAITAQHSDHGQQ